ncbi:hypothetical protein R8O04_23180 [Vibrio sp. 2094]|uniref:hypothetical protein n=1 Tax=unclassified Vibrio TaxID=2614977 RepID=UPI00280C5E55|nr:MULTISPECIES: hypothetical protein [unclassified Vibrio]ELB2850416.1 hypothetical protein [Vibrio alginolyticus]MDW2073291.1 hypothetical protein [Vibrio sp. 2096]MDW3143951.1 hypothetical protein [Vibrio sp. 2094]
MFKEQSEIIVKASGDEIDYLKGIRQCMSDKDFKLLVKNEFSKYIKNTTAVNHMIDSGSHAYELSTILKMSNSVWFASALDYFCSAFRSAMLHHPEEVISIVEECYTKVHHSLANYHDAFFLQNYESLTQTRLKVRAYFRMLGDTLESVHFPHIQFMYQVLTKVPDSVLYGRKLQVSNGKAVSELLEINEFRLALEGSLKNVSLSQWRNISHHSSYHYDTTRDLVICTYGNDNKVELTFNELETLMVDFDTIQALLKICVDFPLMDFLGSFEFDSSLELTVETLLSQLGNTLALNSYTLIGIDKVLNSWTINIEDTGMRGVKGFKSNGPMFFPYIGLLSEKGINVTLELFTPAGTSIQKAMVQSK